MSSLGLSRLRAALLAFGAVVAPGLLAAGAEQEGRMRGLIPFSVHDTDRDGYINREEFQALRERRRVHHAARGRPVQAIREIPTFEEMDRDRDGRISEAEMIATLQQLQARRKGAGPRGERQR